MRRVESLVAGRCAFLAFVVVSSAAPRARACGVSATGVASCSLAEHREAERPRWLAGIAGTYTLTALRFSSTLRADQTRYATLAELAYLPTPALALEAGYGVAFGGSLSLADGTHDFSPGPTAFLGAAWHVVDAPKDFVVLTSVLSFSAARTHLDDERSPLYEAFDLRLGGEVGVNLAEIFHPYALGRIFGGPVYWRYAGRAVTGTDVHHYQLGAGLSVGFGDHVSALVEGVPLGERAASAGVSVAF
ncbi:MAG TPA: hypothetical protein VMI54_22650 [Polyangiaceae bacterium]|nr:hypothetical protein [Polyangiaceae bacterium]